MNWQDAFNFGGSNAANSLASSYSQSSGLADAFKSGGSTLLKDLASSYTAPSSTVADDFFLYSPDKDSSIDWDTMIANPDVLQGIGDSYPDLFKNGVDFLKDFTSDEKSQFFDAQKAAAGLPTDKSRESWYQQVSPSVGIYGGGNAFMAGGNNSVGNLASSYPQIASSPVGFRPAGSAMGIHDIAKMGAGVVQGKLTDMALAAVPGIGPALVIANKLHPDGVVGVAKDVGRFAGDVVGGIAKGAGGIVKGIGNFFCDERLKVDIAPLESTEVNDELAQMAFFVKGLRECS